MRIYEYDAREIDELLPFRNAIFGQLSREHWFAMNNTGVVAREGDELAGFIPLQYRAANAERAGQHPRGL